MLPYQSIAFCASLLAVGVTGCGSAENRPATQFSDEGHASGSLSRDAVQAVINQNVDRIRQCYGQALARNPNLSGSARFAWTITPAGGVSELSSQGGTMTDSQVSNCISEVIRRMQFPRPQGGPVQIVYPFIFQPSE